MESCVEFNIRPENLFTILKVDLFASAEVLGFGIKPVRAHFGELDDFVGFSDVTAVKKLEEKLKESEAPHEIHMFHGKRHAFMNSAMGMPDEDDAAVQLAWSRFEKWMTYYLYS
ncbi:uncharacterized protein LOC130712477 [Lotus japonicus]|uniref:uncharacterized protein LOC130712477 n=1 Tax=Lotus japonicus TaxID=34305 RepID=UPI002585941D|nr:uncharacterized protein LOC130712477 [Lotus japonicus]